MPDFRALLFAVIALSAVACNSEKGSSSRSDLPSQEDGVISAIEGVPWMLIKLEGQEVTGADSGKMEIEEHHWPFS